ncbi:hypothetical protein [Thermomonospora umbrina]|uniref:GDSL-like lipase/acylhydrolase family protein n=1 Tax=Thermomonospora umbrina TaxID=111806 RepID=A0A3D9SK10_9ACTN|nr:hypothetical protein [Thermomonospora umbrina]REE96252.1 hypothetical protein DFJ69_1682 [Thermomonospora umbrina]
MEQQKRLTPYMRQYEDFAMGDIRWLPYVMFFNRTGYGSAVLNTDSGGFRVSHGPSGPCSLQDAPPAGEVGVLLGASPAFGLGVSSDGNTLPSLLARGPDAVPWLNLAAPAFNSTQEVLLFLLHRHQLTGVRDIVVFSGLNNLVVAGLPAAKADYGQFFFSGAFFRQLGAPDQEQPRWALGRIAQATRRIGRDREPGDGQDVPDPAERVDVAVRQTARDLARLLELAAPTGARVHFVLQPTVSWCGKPYSPEERALIEENDRERPQMWDLFRPVLDPSVHRAYAHRLETACKELGVAFLDANTALGASPAADSWLFVDQAHLNDHGTRTVAEILKAELAL